MYHSSCNNHILLSFYFFIFDDLFFFFLLQWPFIFNHNGNLPAILALSYTRLFHVASKINRVFQRQSLVPKTMTPLTSSSNFLSLPRNSQLSSDSTCQIAGIKSLVHITPWPPTGSQSSPLWRMTLCLLDNPNCLLTVWHTAVAAESIWHTTYGI